MKVFISKPVPETAYALLRAESIDTTTFSDSASITRDELIAQCQKHDALIFSGAGILDADFFERCKNLKVVSLFSAGYDSVDVAAATRTGIPVGNTPGVLSAATADIAFLLMLAVSRKAFYSYRRILEEDRTKSASANDFFGIELYGKTLGIFGLGKIGFEMARKCKSMYDMQIIYHNRHPNEKAEQALNARYVGFEALLQQSDVLSNHAGLSPETKEIFNKNAFNKMKPNAIFINTGRGAMHNETDLKTALETGKIWGAGLDVTNPEPMDKNNPLLRMPNVCITPHIGSATAETRNAMARLAAQNAIAGLKGTRLPAIVNPEVYFLKQHNA